MAPPGGSFEGASRILGLNMHSEITAYVNSGDSRKIADHLVVLCEKAGMRRVEPTPLDPGYRLTPSDYWTIAILPGKEGWSIIKSLPWNILCEPSRAVGSMRFVDLSTALGTRGLLLDVYDGGPWGNLVAETDGTGNRFLNGYYIAANSNALEYYGTRLDEDASFTGYVKFEVFSDLVSARRIAEAKRLTEDECREIARELGGENGRRYWSTGEDSLASWGMIDAAMSFGLTVPGAVLLAFEAAQPSQPRYKLTHLAGAYVRGLAEDFAAQQDYVHAALWYRKAAELGDAEAAYQMNTLYREGKGVPKDLEQAEDWLAKVRPLLKRARKHENS